MSSTPPFSSFELSDQEYKLFQDLIHKQFGISLSDAKQGLLVSRLQKLVKQGGYGSFMNYYKFLKAHPGSEALSELVNAISTNYTYFYRENEHFKLFTKKILPEMEMNLKRRNDRDFRVWCAAASTGEEPYTLAMLIMEHFGNQYGFWDAGLLATDISMKALATAKQGVYPSEEVEPLPPVYKNKYFQKLPDGRLKVIDRVKKEVLFRRFNLISRVFPFKKPFHVIFCRNVMIYFDQPTKDALVKKLYQFLYPGGYLIVGHAETVSRQVVPFKYVQPGVFYKEAGF